MKGRMAGTSITAPEGCTENRHQGMDGEKALSAVLQAFPLQDGQLEEAIWMKGPVAGSCASRSFEMCTGYWSRGGECVQWP